MSKKRYYDVYLTDTEEYVGTVEERHALTGRHIYTYQEVVDREIPVYQKPILAPGWYLALAHKSTLVVRQKVLNCPILRDELGRDCSSICEYIIVQRLGGEHWWSELAEEHIMREEKENE